MNDCTLKERLTTYLHAEYPSYNTIDIVLLDRIPGGASCATYRLHVNFVSDLDTRKNHWILRISPKEGLIDTERSTEYRTCQALAGTKVPVPGTVLLEEDESHFGTSFMIVEEVQGCEADPLLFKQSPYLELVDKIGVQKWSILGELTQVSPDKLFTKDDFDALDTTPSWKAQLDYWVSQITENQLEPQPFVAAVIRWMYKNPPPAPERLSIVHGDFRSGNFLYNNEGDFKALIDWEMCHLGDPLEDIAWAMTSVWSSGGTCNPGFLISREKALLTWEKTSGLRVDPQALHWWEIFSCIKGIAIWTTGGTRAANSSECDYILFGGAWWAMDIQLSELEKIFSKKFKEGLL